MLTLSVTPDDPAITNLIATLNRVGSGAGLTNTENAFSAISGAIATAWQQKVGSEFVIQRKKISPFNHYVYSEDDMVHWLEYGLPSFDMKSTHTKGRKSRVVKPRLGRGGKLITEWKQKRQDGSEYTVRAGDTYLIIPIRHKTTEKSPTDESVSLGNVYSSVKSQMKGDFKKSEVTKSPENSNTSTPNAWGEMIKRAEYSWGDKLQFPEEDKYRNLRGMVPMKTTGNKSSYMTFRVVSVNSPAGSWIHPGIEAKHILQDILDKGQDEIKGIIDEALRRDFT